MSLESIRAIANTNDGQIIQVRDTKSQRDFVAKVLNIHKHNASRKVRDEMAFLARIGKDRHLRSTIALCHGSVTGPDLCGFLMDYVAWPTLEQYLKNPNTRKLNAVVLGRRMYWILDRLHNIHGIAHRDIKSANILVNEVAGNIKLIDYGLATTLSHKLELSTEGACTPLYSAPEVLCGGKPFLLSKIDVFSVGMVIWETAAGRHPLEGAANTIPELAEKYIESSCLNPESMPPGILRELLSRVLQYDFYMRPSAAEAFSMFYTANDSA